MAPRALATSLAVAVTAVALAHASTSARAITDGPPVGNVVEVATIGDFDANGVQNTRWIDAVRARLEAANPRGGIVDASHQLRLIKVIPCNAASDPDQTTRCAQQAVERGVAAVVGLSAVYADRALPILAAARIPAIGVRVNGGLDTTSPASFPFASGLEAELLAMPQLLAHRGATKIAVIISDFGTATDDAVAVLQQGRSLTSAMAGPVVRVVPGTEDYAAAVTAALEPGVDGVVGFLAGGPRGAIAEHLRAAQYTGDYVTRAPWGAASSASDPVPHVSRTLLVGHFPPPTSRTKGWDQLQRDLGMNPRQSATIDEGTANAWLAAYVFEHLVEDIGLAWLKTTVLEPIVYSSVDNTGGLTPRLTSLASHPTLPRLFNPAVTFSVMRDGVPFLLDRRFFDPYRGEFLR